MPAPTGRPPARRQALRCGAALGLAGLAAATVGCGGPPPLLRIGAHPWPGYELMFLAQDLGLVSPAQTRLVELPAASASLRALAAGTLEGAGLTLDEVLSARARGLMLRVVAVLDVSHGADALLARPGIGSMAALRGRRIGVEQSATGALVLDAALASAGLRPADVRQLPLAFSEHAAALRERHVDAVVSFEPARSQLLAEGAQVLFSSDMTPGLIVDVLAVRPEATRLQADALRRLVGGSLQARDALQRDAEALAARMAPRLQLPPAGVMQAFSGLELPDLAANHGWLGGPAPTLHASARRLAAVMQRAGLLQPGTRPLDDTGGPLADPLFLPALSSR